MRIAAKIVVLPEKLRKSLTWEQGAELAQHVRLRIEVGLAIYFCDPRSPWQRGSNENTNGLLRRYFPKGADISRYSEHDLHDLDANRIGGSEIVKPTRRWIQPIFSPEVLTLTPNIFSKPTLAMHDVFRETKKVGTN